MKIVPLILVAAMASGCSTMNESLQLGGSLGFGTGAVASYAGYSINGNKATLENVAVGAGIGLGIGLIASYFTHREVEEDRERNYSDQTEIHFGDLPPSPFLIPKSTNKKGVRK